MLISEEKIHARFANVCPNGVPADIVDLIKNKLSGHKYKDLAEAARHWREQDYQKLSKAGDHVRAIKARAAELEARAAALKQQIASVDPLAATPEEIDDARSKLAGCETLIQLLADALPPAQAAEERARLVSDECNEMARIVDELTRRWTVLTPEAKAELLADFLTDAEHARIFTPEYLEQKRIAQEKAEAEAKRAKERDEERRRRQAEEQAAKRAPYDRIDAMTVPEILEDLFAPLPPPETLKWHIQTRQAIQEAVSPHLWNWRDDALKTYALNQIVYRVSQGKPID